MALSKQDRIGYAYAITEMTEERTEHEGEEPGDYADARRHYIDDASDDEILKDFQNETKWKAKRNKV